MNYNEIISALMTLGSVPLNSEDSNFQKIVPAMFHFADGLIYRDLNFLQTDVITQYLLTPMTRDYALSRTQLTVRTLSILTPRDPLNAPTDTTPQKRRWFPERVSPEATDMFWPQENYRPGVPRKYAVVGYRIAPEQLPNPNPPTTQPLPPHYIPEKFILRLRLIPSPDRAYMAEVYGGVEPAILSPENPETLLSRFYSELFIAACMVYLTGYQRDYGASSDDPQRAMSWQAQYQMLKTVTEQEIGRTRGEGPGFTALPSSGQAQQPRSP